MMMRSWIVASLVVAMVGVASAPVEAVESSRAEVGRESVLLDDGAGNRIWKVGDWLRRTHSEELDVTGRFSLQGRWDGEKCIWEYEEVIEAGSVGASPAGVEVVEREIARNDKTCEMVLERGTRPVSSAEPEVLLGSNAGEPVAASSTGSRAMWQRLAHVDPEPVPGIDVNWVKSGQSYSWNGICVTNQYNITASRGYAWATGWYSTLYQKSSSGDVCSPYVWRNVKAYANNLIFCNPAAYTYSRFYANEVRGYPNGNYGYYYSHAYWGDCAAWLHFERTKSP